MEMKFDPLAKVRQGDFSQSNLDTKDKKENINLKVSVTKADAAAETANGKVNYIAPKVGKNHVDANFFSMADKKDY